MQLPRKENDEALNAAEDNAATSFVEEIDKLINPFLSFALFFVYLNWILGQNQFVSL